MWRSPNNSGVAANLGLVVFLAFWDGAAAAPWLMEFRRTRHESSEDASAVIRSVAGRYAVCGQFIPWLVFGCKPFVAQDLRLQKRVWRYAFYARYAYH